MSSPTWTPDALSSEALPYSGIGWRIVEAQHYVSTMKLVDSVAEQDLLEGLLETTKPPIPPECAGLDFLLATPFRYGAVYPTGSRFRRAGRTPGVFYAAEAPETAVAEIAFYRLLLHCETPTLPFPSNPAEFTGFSVSVETGAAIDLTVAPFAADRSLWTAPTEYGPCQALADQARNASIELIRHQSARDPKAGANLALLSCSAFAAPKPLDRQTWRIRIAKTGVQARREFPNLAVDFSPADFSTDPRIAKRFPPT
ncbi:MAG: RES family NAD+ phosphorylase [Hyphomicrobiales bacterium]|nr:RES family NAD+ phosphorylase [Hyphomicrobiales bacterium]